MFVLLGLNRNTIGERSAVLLLNLSKSQANSRGSCSLSVSGSACAESAAVSAGSMANDSMEPCEQQPLVGGMAFESARVESIGDASNSALDASTTHAGTRP